MFENLEEVVMHYEEVINELSEPDVLNNQTKYRKLMKEQTDLTPIVEKYKEYKEVKAGIEVGPGKVLSGLFAKTEFGEKYKVPSINTVDSINQL